MLSILILAVAIIMAVVLPIMLNGQFKNAGVQGVLKYNLGIVFASLGGLVIGYLVAVGITVASVNAATTQAQLYAASMRTAWIWLGFTLVGCLVAALVFRAGRKKLQTEVAARFNPGGGQAGAVGQQYPPAFYPGNPHAAQPPMPYMPPQSSVGQTVVPVPNADAQPAAPRTLDPPPEDAAD